MEHAPITKSEQWYVDPKEDDRTGALTFKSIAEQGEHLVRKYQDFKREADARMEGFEKLEKLADARVISEKPDLPNVSSGETSGIVRRMARNLVQNVPNMDVISQFDDDELGGVMARFILTSKIIGSDQYSNDMQQNLFSSTKTSLTLGFDTVVPILLQRGSGEWYVHYDTIHYRDVFAEPGAKDIRQANEVFIRRYLTKGDIKALIANSPAGWDTLALRRLLLDYPKPPNREYQSNSHSDKEKHLTADGYEVVTWYNNSGHPFLTFCPKTRMLFRVEKNLHPAKEHPVQFLVLEKDAQQPYGKSQVELLLGRQEFQDLMHNGAMKMWYRNINPPVIGYGTVNAVPNLSPGKFTPISNPNAKLEPFEVNTQTLLQYSAITQGNLGSMVQMVGAADQQMATQNGQPGGMSSTPQGVEAQQAMVDITTNNYQKAIESFFSHYCSYALTMYFQEMSGIRELVPTADARDKLFGAGLDLSLIDDKGVLKADFSNMAVEYWARAVPGSLVEIEDEKQLRILQSLFVPLSQAMPALAATQDPEMVKGAASAMQFILEKSIELSGANSAKDLKSLLKNGRTEQFDEYQQMTSEMERALNESIEGTSAQVVETQNSLELMREQMATMAATQQLLLEKLGVLTQGSNPQEGQYTDPAVAEGQQQLQ